MTASGRLDGDFCDGCSAPLLQAIGTPAAETSDASEGPVSCEDCDDATFCSQSCLELARESYHSAVCGSDVSAMAKAVPTAESADALYCLLLLRTLAMSQAQDIHPLDLKEVKYIWSDFHSQDVADAFRSPHENVFHCLPRTLPFSFKYSILMPLNMLEKMDVNIFDNGGRFDTWVFNTLYAKIRGTASAKQGRDSRPDVGAVHPLWCLANHSCDPNVTWDWRGKIQLWAKQERAPWVGKPETERDQAGVPKGGELMSHYCDVRLDVRERREWAIGALGGLCKCERCLWEEQQTTAENES